jgi:prolyl-tRNA synthetase
MGGSQSQEFMVYTEAGEDLIASSASGYAANLEKAVSVLTPIEDLAPTGNGLPELVHTPGKGAIADICEFLGILPSQDIKCVAFMGTVAAPTADTPLRPVVAFLRGDHQVNETKLCAIAGVAELRPMVAEELALHIGGPAGYLGPVGITEVMTQGSLNGLNSGKELAKLKGVSRENAPGGQENKAGLKTIVIMDLGLEGRKNLVAGANKLDYHYRNVTPSRDFTVTATADIRNVLEGELDPIGNQPLRLGKAVEIGHIFKLGRKYTQSMGATVLNKDGKEVTPIMGSYGIGIERILTAAIETSAAKFASNPDNKQESYALPAAIAPFEVVVTITNVKESDLLTAGESIASDLAAAGFDVLLDDRDERAGVKFKDAEMIGIPYRINIGKKLTEGKVELVDRLLNQTQDVALTDIVSTLQRTL